jgi:hypothetical protein
MHKPPRSWLWHTSGVSSVLGGISIEICPCLSILGLEAIGGDSLSGSTNVEDVDGEAVISWDLDSTRKTGWKQELHNSSSCLY